MLLIGNSIKIMQMRISLHCHLHKFYLIFNNTFSFSCRSKKLTRRKPKLTCCRKHRKTIPHLHQPVGNYRLHNLPTDLQHGSNVMDVVQIRFALLILVCSNMVDSAHADPNVPLYCNVLSIIVRLAQQSLLSCLLYF